jgi:Flp pilus assembly protein TadG
VLLRLSARARSQAGAELVEFALVLPMLLLVFGGIVDFGLLLQRQQVVTNAAREGARIAVLPGYSEADVIDRVREYVREGTGDNTLSPVTVPITVPIDPPGPAPAFPAKQVTVTMTYNYLILSPVMQFFGPGMAASTLTARSTMRIES